MKTWKRIIIPFSLALALALGIIIGNFFAMRSNVGNTLGLFRSLGIGKNKVSQAISLIANRYVDSVNVNDLTDNAMNDLLAGLDPHSTYIPAKDLQSSNEQLEGSFSGVGIEFNIQRDTILVVSVISGGPAEKAGLLPGDRIVNVNDSLFVGKEINNDRVMQKMRGQKGTSIKLGIKRAKRRKLLDYVITRGDVPVTSVEASYLIAPKTGYIKVSKFGDTTYSEFLTALAKIRNQGADKLIIDLRSNTGGYMEAAVKMVNEFLPKNQLIVYAAGRAYPRTDFYSDGRGSFPNIKMAVLMDEWSASASEIFAGAIQDNDRGLIIGIRSFGKGLVQQPFEFADHSAIRLTIARYYSPSGRCIQKPYQLGKDQNYEKDFMNRYLHGEFFSKDSIKILSKEKFKTRGGRTVYGGGGIVPDIFVPLDTTGVTSYYRRLFDSGALFQFAVHYADQHRDKLSTFKDWKDMDEYLSHQPLASLVATYGETKDVPRHYYYFNISHQLISQQAKAYIIRSILGDEGFYASLNQSDVTVKRAVEALQR